MEDIKQEKEKETANTDEEQNNTEEPKKRRRRRTKAEIEADRAAKAAEDEKKQEQDVETGVATSDVASNDQEHSNLIEIEHENESKDDESDSEPVESYDNMEEINGSVHENHDNSVVKGVLHVYKTPSENSTYRCLNEVFTAKKACGDFIKVRFIKRGFGTVFGYVKSDEYNKYC